MTWTTGAVVTAAQMNTHVRDNLSFLQERASVLWCAGGIQTGSGPDTAEHGWSFYASAAAATIGSGGGRGYSLVYNLNPPDPYDFFAKIPFITDLYFRFSHIDATLGIILGEGVNAAFAYEATTRRYFGLEVVGGAARALSCDGTTRSTLDLGTALVADTWYKYKAVLTASALQTWIADVAKTNKTTNLPSGTTAVNRNVGYWAGMKQTSANIRVAYFTAPRIGFQA